jgi:hypothetical protein
MCLSIKSGSILVGSNCMLLSESKSAFYWVVNGEQLEASSYSCSSSLEVSYPISMSGWRRSVRAAENFLSYSDISRLSDSGESMAYYWLLSLSSCIMVYFPFFIFNLLSWQESTSPPWSPFPIPNLAMISDCQCVCFCWLNWSSL